MKCLLDMDGVLVDFVGGACEFYCMTYPYDDPNLHGKWDFINATGLDEEKFWKPLGQDFWANLNPTEDMQEIVRIVEAVFGRMNVCLLTSPCTNDGCMDGKIKWIKRHLPRYSRRYLMGPQKEFCARYDHWLVDDADHNIKAFKSHGGNVCLVPRLWNSLHKVPTIPHLIETLRFPKNPSELERMTT